MYKHIYAYCRINTKNLPTLIFVLSTCPTDHRVKVYECHPLDLHEILLWMGGGGSSAHFTLVEKIVDYIKVIYMVLLRNWVRLSEKKKKTCRGQPEVKLLRNAF